PWDEDRRQAGRQLDTMQVDVDRSDGRRPTSGTRTRGYHCPRTVGRRRRPPSFLQLVPEVGYDWIWTTLQAQNSGTLSKTVLAHLILKRVNVYLYADR